MTVPPVGWEDGFSHLNEIWVPSEFVKTSLRQITTLPIRVVPHALRPISKVSPSYGTGDSNRPLRFLAFADGLSSFERKNLVGAINAYLQAFPNQLSTKLIVKALNLSDYPVFREVITELCDGRDDIEILDETLDVGAVEQLILQNDVLISLHRSEGFGLTIAEAMRAGNIVVCTGWSGNMEFVTPEVGLPVEYDLVPLDDKYNVYNDLEGAVWAEPDIEQASEYLRRIFDSPQDFVSMREKAQAKISNSLNYETYVKALEQSEIELDST